MRQAHTMNSLRDRPTALLAAVGIAVGSTAAMAEDALPPAPQQQAQSEDPMESFAGPEAPQDGDGQITPEAFRKFIDDLIKDGLLTEDDIQRLMTEEGA